MSRPRLPNNITPAPGAPGLCVLTVLTSQVGWSPLVEYCFDAADLELVEQHHWAVGCKGRAAAHVHPARDTVYLARLIVGAVAQQRVLHLDGDVTNLCRSNLHICKPAAITLRRRALFAARAKKGIDTPPALV